jgi:hypothetical protein
MVESENNFDHIGGSAACDEINLNTVQGVLMLLVVAIFISS